MGLDYDYSVGHGRRSDGKFDPGAKGTDGRYEHHEVHEIAAEFAEAALRCGLTGYVEGDGTDSDAEDPNFVGSINRVNGRTPLPSVAIEGHFDWQYGPESFIALHAGSANGERLAKAMAAGAASEGLPLGGTRKDGHNLDEEYGRKIRLAFPRRTHAPAVLIEYGRVKDHPIAVNRAMAEATVRGICTYLGKAYVPRGTATAPGRPAVDYEVAVVWGGDADFGMAAMLSKKHTFKLLTDEEVLGGKVKVRYAVAIGGNRDAVLAKVGDGLAIGGKTRFETADRVYAYLMSSAPDRRRPWA